MQFFLDENTVPIRLFAANSAPSLRRRQVPHRQQQEHQFRFQLPSHHHQQQRSVPGYPYIRFVEDDDLDGGYPFDAFQDLRSAYFSSPLSDIQARMRNIQQQRAQAQLHRSLLEQQLREHERRERELIEYQQRLENERRAHAKAAADRARAAYLSRLEKDEQQRQLDALCAARLAASQKASAQRAELPVNNRDENEGEDDEQAVFYPPFHFFNHILSNQIKSQDDIERKRAERNALNSLLETYFGQSADGSEQKKKDNSQSAAASRESSAGANSAGKSRQASQSPFASNVSQQPAPLMASATADTADNSNPSLAAATRHLPPFGIRSSQLDPGVLDNVLRVVHDRLAEIAADEADEKQQQSASASASPAQSRNNDNDNDKVKVNVNVDVVDEGNEKETPEIDRDVDIEGEGDMQSVVDEPRGVEIEEPTDYSKLADALRRRVSGLNDDNMFLPLSPLLASSHDSESDSELPPTSAQSAEQKQPQIAIDPVANTKADNDDAVHSDKEFADLLNNCKTQLKDMTDATTKHDSEAAHRRRRRRRHHQRSRSRRHQSHNAPKVQEKEQEEAGSATAAVSDAAEVPSKLSSQSKPVVSEPSSKPEETEEQRQKRAVNTIEEYILGARKARKAKEVNESLEKLGKIDQELAKIREDYNWRLRNMQLSFIADKSGNLKLAYNRDNKAFHEYQEVLQRLLLSLDEIQSFDDESVRFKRKTIVKKIQNTLNALDQFAAEQESELSESGAFDVGSLADESSNGELVY